LQADLGLVLPATLAMDYPNVNAIAEFLSPMIFSARPDAKPVVSAPRHREVVPVEVEKISEAEAEDLLRQELDELKHLL
jgi:hypothetical protein